MKLQHILSDHIRPNYHSSSYPSLDGDACPSQDQPSLRHFHDQESSIAAFTILEFTLLRFKPRLHLGNPYQQRFAVQQRGSRSYRAHRDTQQFETLNPTVGPRNRS
jgi:hypothetical protein